MNEEEIIKNIKEMIQWSDHNTYKIALQGILDLYNKEKEKNNSISIQYEKVVDKLEDLEQIEKEHKEENGRLREKLDKKNETEKLRYYKRGFYAGFECFENRLRENLESLKKDYKEALEENSTKAFILKNVK